MNCEKCGEEIGNKIIGDESYPYCPNCNWFTLNSQKARQWKNWECWIMNKIDFRFWNCDCHYQAPYGKVIFAGCKKHD